jgi:hypothetical protein
MKPVTVTLAIWSEGNPGISSRPTSSGYPAATATTRATMPTTRQKDSFRRSRRRSMIWSASKVMAPASLCLGEG